MQDFTIEEFENSMTLYYFKSDGAIHSWCTGINDMRTFIDHKDDFSLILDYIVLPLYRYVIDNLKHFTIDVEEKELCFNAPSVTYRVKE